MGYGRLHSLLLCPRDCSRMSVRYPFGSGELHCQWLVKLVETRSRGLTGREERIIYVVPHSTDNGAPSQWRYGEAPFSKSELRDAATTQLSPLTNSSARRHFDVAYNLGLQANFTDSASLKCLEASFPSPSLRRSLRVELSPFRSLYHSHRPGGCSWLTAVGGKQRSDED